jgi:PBSX family phage terminase large subunit
MSEVRLNIKDQDGNPSGWLPKQQEFLEAPEKFLGYVGGFGSGKTVVMSANGILLSMEYPGNRGVIDSPTTPKLRDDVIPVFRDLCPESLLKGGSWDTAFHGTNLDLTFVNGSVVNFRAPDDHEKIKGPTIGWFGMDEASDREYEFFKAYRGRLRKPGVRRCGMVSTNPESKLHWIYRLFYEKEDETPLNTYRLIHAPSYENVYLAEDYLEDLRGFDKEWRKRYYEGQFSAFSGQVYGELNERIHFVEPGEWRHWLKEI